MILQKNRIPTFLIMGMCLFFCSSLLFSDKKSERAGKTNETKKFGKGELRVIEGIPFLKLSGSYYEMGEQYGTLLKAEFQKIYKQLSPYKNLWLPKLPGDTYERLEKLTNKQVIQQLKGMAAGSGLPYSDLLLGAYFGVLERGGCSSILMKINDGNSDRLIHGRNYDYGKGTGKYPVVIEYNPQGGIKHFIIGTIGSAGLAEGMNEKGITISGNLAPGNLKNNLIQNASPDIKLREILKSASSMKDVEILMEGYASDVGHTFTIGSGFELDGIIYDMNYDNVKKNYLNNRNCLFATNGYMSEELNPAKDDLRYQIIDRYVKSGQVNSIDEMIELLSDPGTSFGVNNPSTVHSVVFDAMHKNVYMAFNTKFAAWSDWLRYDWNKDYVTVYKEAEEDKLKNTDIAELTEVHVIAAYWNGNLPIRAGEPKRNDPHFWLLIKEWLKEKGVEQLYEFSTRAARELTLKAKGHPDVKAIITKGTIAVENLKGVMFKIIEEDLPKMVPNIPYTICIENVSAIYRWIIEDGVTLTRPGENGSTEGASLRTRILALGVVQ
jgi:hypothetical protein